MSIKVTQMCDSCGRDRTLKYTDDLIDILSRKDGWLPVLGSKHVCIDCIKSLVKD